jgi:hypothetical protein
MQHWRRWISPADGGIPVKGGGVLVGGALGAVLHIEGGGEECTDYFFELVSQL